MVCMSGEKIKEPYGGMYKEIKESLKNLGFKGKIPPEICYNLFAREAYVSSDANDTDIFDMTIKIGEKSVAFEAKYQKEDTISGNFFYTLYICKITYDRDSLEVKIEIPCMYERF